MVPGELKPLLGTLLLPPASLLLLALLGMLLGLRRRRTGAVLTLSAFVLLWLLSCHGFSLLLGRALLPPVAALSPTALPAGMQAVVVLGGGVLPQAQEYGTAQPSVRTLARLRYGAWLSKATGAPLAFAGGIGWSSHGMDTRSEAQVAQQVLKEWQLEARWLDDRSRDTHENARQMRALLQPAQVQRIALVTEAGHMPRAVLEFERAGFTVVPAPTGLAGPRERGLLEWLPSGEGLASSRFVLREWLALRAAAFQ